MIQISDFLRQQQKLLLSLSALYLTLMILPQMSFSSPHIWLIAAAFSVFLNLLYMAETHGRRAFVGPETFLACLLIAVVILGLVVAHGLIVFAIFAQGILHLFRRLQAGEPLLALNALGCFAVDMMYGIILLVICLR
tara:strand:- start:1015 stop:1425 length:411 start_codon:yes stop_codon:yes gene_type:complete